MPIKVAEGNSVSLYQNDNKFNRQFRTQSRHVADQPCEARRCRPAVATRLILFAVTSVGWGLNFPIMKLLLTEWPQLSSRGLCGIVGAAALALFALARRQKLSVPRSTVMPASPTVSATARSGDSRSACARSRHWCLRLAASRWRCARK
ncbi:hypothetical protein [Bradyrhizobium murdochi]|uniref:hypothetical protein n=1 Tax=Bradyrhizobium murdochi TaxID=1038859 RepID=UPI0003F7F962|nr:hypothetical protein [Bradyrhizobium murdochi]